MKKIYCILALILCLISCNEKIEQKPVTPVDGIWYTYMEVDGEPVVEVYVTFDRGDFIIYQKSGTQRRFFTYRGTFTYNNGIISGRYDDAIPWGAEYIVSVYMGELFMEDVVTGEINIYYKEDEIPAEVLQNAVPALTTRAAGTAPVL